MSIPCKFEGSILSYDEHEIILRSHHPEIYDAGLDDLKALRQRLRDMRDKERTLLRKNPGWKLGLLWVIWFGVVVIIVAPLVWKF